MKFFQLQEEKENKKQQQIQLLVLIILGGIGYYLFFFLPDQRKEVETEIEEAFRHYSPVTTDNLDNNLWKRGKSWKEHLKRLYFSFQIDHFREIMIEAYQTKEKRFRSR